MYSTFEALSMEEFETHAQDLLGKGRSSRRRREVLTYLQSINKFDEELIEAERTTLRSRVKQLRKKQVKLDAFQKSHRVDFTKREEWLTDETLTLTELSTALGQNDSEIFINQQYSGDLTISGNDIILQGDGNETSARTESLANTSSITGDIIVSGKDTIIKNINFNSVSSKGIRFLEGAENITLENCVFTAPSNDNDSKFLYGQFFKGTCTIINCIVQGYTSWMLFDISSTSGEPEHETDYVRIKRCLFRNNLGSAAIRGKTGSPTKLIQINNNKFITNSMHQYFWAFIEASGHIKKCEFKNNEFIGPDGNEQIDLPRHAVQAWSKNPRPWTITYEGNSISNMKLGLCIAHNSGFFSPDTDADAFKIALGTQTNVTYGASFAHNNLAGDLAANERWLQNAVYNPTNIATYQTAPPVENPLSYTVLTG